MPVHWKCLFHQLDSIDDMKTEWKKILEVYIHSVLSAQIISVIDWQDMHTRQQIKHH